MKVTGKSLLSNVLALELGSRTHSERFLRHNVLPCLEGASRLLGVLQRTSPIETCRCSIVPFPNKLNRASYRANNVRHASAMRLFDLYLATHAVFALWANESLRYRGSHYIDPKIVGQLFHSLIHSLPRNTTIPHCPRSAFTSFFSYTIL